MKFGIYKEETEEEKPLKIRLVRNFNSIRVQVVDDDGRLAERGYIASITEGGYLMLWDHVNPKFGLQLDEAGRIKIENQIREIK
ncbi:MAG: hypothetical protein SVM80_12375 [Halobacteriota archaeon]|nr:hypothetical protein [Halobacteriota archaeon]